MIIRKSWKLCRGNLDFRVLTASLLRLEVTLLSGPFKFARALFLLIRMSFGEQGQCLQCCFSNSSSPATAPYPLKMYACAKFVSTPSLVRSTSQLLSRSLSAVVLKRPETLTDEVPCRWNWACGLKGEEAYLAEPVGGVLGTVITDKN